MAWLLPDHRRNSGRTDDLSLEERYHPDHRRLPWLSPFWASGWARCAPSDTDNRAWTLPTAGLYGPLSPLSSATLRRFCPSGGLRCPSIMWPPILSSWGSFSGLSGFLSFTPTSPFRLIRLFTLKLARCGLLCLSLLPAEQSPGGTALSPVQERPGNWKMKWMPGLSVRGVMFVEMMLGPFRLDHRRNHLRFAPVNMARPSPRDRAPSLQQGCPSSWAPWDFRPKLGKSYGSVMMIVLAITIMQLVIRFMRVATSELLSDVSPVFRNAHVGTLIASLLGIIVVLTGWWQYLWVLFGGAIS